MKKMTKEKDKMESRYPLRSLHDFLSELDREWDRFRSGSLIGVVISLALLIVSFSRMLTALRNRSLLELIFMIVIVVALVYTVLALYAQHKFFRRWERRIGLLLHMEEKIINDELEKDK